MKLQTFLLINLQKFYKLTVLPIAAALFFIGCMDRKSVINNSIPKDELNIITANNKAYFDSIYIARVLNSKFTLSRLKKIKSTNKLAFDSLMIGPPLVLKDTAYLYFSEYPMYACTTNATGTLVPVEEINEEPISWVRPGTTMQTNAFMGTYDASTYNVYQLIGGNYVNFDIRYYFVMQNYAVGQKLRTEIAASPAPTR